ncbi:hypothetical protein [Streptomyces halobius]|uniref:Uncharacterized protein n=1 Tax=Streptomyces halobius TaxID=2879846 RepID=A0ABY4M7C0_9ACTN|nr:hypothetical protein [Streptomyces halobius]UQA92281.1 hypothetical protein K9S39_10895 [Streptomyces halobius]
MRPLSAPDAPRVKAHRRQHHEGILPPALLWWVGGLDSLVLLDGHDRLAAALAEGGRPAALALARERPERRVRWAVQPIVRDYEERLAPLERARGLSRDRGTGGPTERGSRGRLTGIEGPADGDRGPEEGPAERGSRDRPNRSPRQTPFPLRPPLSGMPAPALRLIPLPAAWAVWRT